MTQFERFQERMLLQYEVNRKSGRKPWDDGAQKKRKPPKSASDARRPFDASKWRLTPEAMRLLVRSGAVKIPKPASTAEEMEAKYGGQLTAIDRIMQRFSNPESPSERYKAIEAMSGRNGDCKSRKTTYRRFKFGKGNVSERGFLESGFPQNAATSSRRPRSTASSSTSAHSKGA